MFEWKVEDMALLKDDAKYSIGKKKIYRCEENVSREDKIEFVDRMNDGKLTYILELWKKWKEDAPNLPKDRFDSVKTVSLKAWIKRNDYRKILDDSYRYGNIRFIVRRNIQILNAKGMYDTHWDYIDEVFHIQLVECEKMERQYFLEHDEYSILKEEFRSRNKYGTTFEVNIAMCSDGEIYVYDGESFYDSKYRPITIDELNALLVKYKEIDELVEKLTKEINIEY